jgi:hypothetical protein
MDEAGTSASEPVSIVVGLIVNADEQLMFTEAAINEALGAVPEKFSNGFIFHAKDVWGSPEYRDEWRMSDRLALLTNMMMLPRRLKISVSLGMVRREAPLPDNIAQDGKMTAEQYHHWMAFTLCVGTADLYIREHADPREVASIVAEDVPEMRKFLRNVPKILRIMPPTLPGGMVPSKTDREKGYVAQRSEMRVSRIRPSVHFAGKRDESLLQLADACAFGFRRYFSGQDFGADFVKSIIGRQLVLEDYAGHASFALFDHSMQRNK